MRVNIAQAVSREKSMTRTHVIVIMLACPTVGLILAAYFGMQLRQFVRSTPELRSNSDLDAFKRLVKGQMYAALAQIVILSIPILIFAVGFWKKIVFTKDIVYLFVPSLIILAVGMLLKSVERNAQQVPAVNEELKQERDRIVDIWLHQPFPNW